MGMCPRPNERVHRFTANGKLHGSLAAPFKKPMLRAFSGVNLDTFSVTPMRSSGVDF